MILIDDVELVKGKMKKSISRNLIKMGGGRYVHNSSSAVTIPIPSTNDDVTSHQDSRRASNDASEMELDRESA